MPKVSVIMPVYNTPENYLREAIESILKQTYSDFEFIIINDGSTNNAESVILSYGDSRIVYVKNEQNLKLIKTLNKAFELAKGEYIIRMDADDISVKNRIEKSVEYMDNNRNIAAAGTYAIGTPNKLRFMPPKKNEDIKPFLRYVMNCMIHPSMIIRTCILRENNLLYDENYLHNEDYKLWLLLNKIGELANIPEVLLVHRLHETSVSVKYTQEQLRITNKILWENLLCDFAPKNKKLEKIVYKFFNSEKLELSEFCCVSKFLCKVVKKLKRLFPDEIYPYIIKIYTDNYTEFALSTKPVFWLLVAIWISPFGAEFGIGVDFKKNLADKILLNMRSTLSVV